MTEVTRIACPGCRSLLRFEPEALDFPANCGACECRFTAVIYVRIACPKCHCGSKIRESYLGRMVRCVRCRHDFLADDGIPPGAGGRLLVAKRLDTNLPETPETIQPFLGHARAEAESRLPAPEDGRIKEAERLKAEAIAERDRLAEESGFFKSILSRLVGSSSDPEALELARLVADRDQGPGSTGLEGATARELVEERDRLDLYVGGLKAELEPAREEFEEHLELLAREPSTARQAAEEADERSKAAEETLAWVILEHLDSARKAHELIDDLGQLLAATGRERSALSTTIDRLNLAVLSARAGEAEALARLDNFARKLGDADAKALAERRRTFELGNVVGELKVEIESIRKAEAEKALEIDAELSSERRKGLDLGRLVEDLRAEIDVLRAALAEKSSALTEQSTGFEEARQGLVAELKRSRLEAEEATRIAKDEVARAGQQFDSANALAEQAQAEVVRVEAKHRAELGNLAALLAERENTRLASLEENKTLVAELKRLRAEAEGPQAEKERLAEAVDRLLDENQQLTESTKRLQAENRRMTAEVKAVRASRPEDRGVPVEADGEAIKAEAVRREQALLAEIQRLKEGCKKLATAKNAGKSVQQHPSKKTPTAEPGRPSDETQAHPRGLEASAAGPLLSMSFASPSDVWEPDRPIVAGPVDPAESEARAGDGNEVDIHRDVVSTLLYGDSSDDGELARPTGDEASSQLVLRDQPVPPAFHQRIRKAR